MRLPVTFTEVVMRVVRAFPHVVQEIENVWIPMSDGCRLAARLWLPQSASQTAVPAILESIPYRKRDGTRERDEIMHGWFAGHGYACIRLDVRGTGDSEGLLADEYSVREQQDAVEAIGWMAAQPWCSGAVGMIGKSWGGIAALQTAALQPAALRAVIAVCATDDRFATDAHWMGGSLLLENLLWGTLLMAQSAQPPDPEIAGDAWRDTWRARLESLPLHPETWMRHPQRDAYWRNGSVCEEWSRIECPVLAVGGWMDAYVDFVPRVLANLTSARGIIGPWAHLYPHEGIPGPAIGFLQEAKRWWDHWLRNETTGLESEPRLRAWMPNATEGRGPERDTERGGRWVAESEWPSPRIETRSFPLGTSESEVRYRSPQTTGLATGPWCSFGIEPDLASDTRAEDARSLVFETDPLPDGLEILGLPAVRLSLSVDTPAAFVAARLVDVAPGGGSRRVSWGVLDLSLRGDPSRRESVEPGARYEITVPLRSTAHAFAAGHRLRVALSTTLWPIVWPSLESTTLTVFPNASHLDLPVRPAKLEDEALRGFEPPEGALTSDMVEIDPGEYREQLEVDPATGATVLMTRLDARSDGSPTMTRFSAIDLEVGHSIVERFSIHPDTPLSALAEVTHRTVRRRGAWEAKVGLQTRLTATDEAWHLEAKLEASECGERIATREWQASVLRPRAMEDST